MKKNASIIGLVLGVIMIVLHFSPWATTETQMGTAFSEGMSLILTIPNFVTIILAILYLMIFLLFLLTQIKNINPYKILGAIFSLMIAIVVSVNIFTAPDNYGRIIIGEAYSFGFGEKVKIGFGLYLLLIAALFGSIISFLYTKKEPKQSIS
jgi:uncharacterized protein YebE (UPF0316 family)